MLILRCLTKWRRIKPGSLPQPLLEIEYDRISGASHVRQIYCQTGTAIMPQDRYIACVLAFGTTSKPVKFACWSDQLANALQRSGLADSCWVWQKVQNRSKESGVGRFTGKVAIVSGAASGMGEMEARIIAAEGGKVVLTDVNAELGEKVAADIGSSAVFQRHDVSDEAGWGEVVELARSKFGPPTVLINNGGVGAYGGIHEIETEYMRRIMEINFMGSFFGIRAVLPSMRESGGGAIVNISSGLATISLAGYFPVGTSKWAVRGMTRLAAKDLAQFNVRVNTVFPGAIDTPSLVQEVRDNAKNLIPLGRAGGSDECARVVTFLASDEASYVSGAEVMVDGAMLC